MAGAARVEVAKQAQPTTAARRAHEELAVRGRDRRVGVEGGVGHEAPNPGPPGGLLHRLEAHDAGSLAGRIDGWRSISSGAYGRRRLKRTRRRVTAITQPPMRLGGGTC